MVVSIVAFVMVSVHRYRLSYWVCHYDIKDIQAAVIQHHHVGHALEFIPPEPILLVCVCDALGDPCPARAGLGDFPAVKGLPVQTAWDIARGQYTSIGC
jgi:hypothetical protein